MNSRERFIATVERKPVDRPACWLGDPTPEAVPALCDYYHVDNIKELKKVCGDDFYAVEIPYKSPTCSAIFAAFDWYMNGSNVDTEHRTLTADGCFAQCEDLEDVEAVNFPWPDPELYIDPEECRRLVDEAPDDKVVMGMLWACHFQDTCAAFGIVLADDSDQAIGAAEACEAAGRDDIVIVAAGISKQGLDLVKDGKLYGMSYQTCQGDAGLAVRTISEWFCGIDVNRVNYLRTDVVTSENTADFEPCQW